MGIAKKLLGMADAITDILAPAILITMLAIPIFSRKDVAAEDIVSEWNTISNSINGSFSNSLSFKTVDSKTNGSFTNISLFKIISGSFSSLFKTITNDFTGLFTNTSKNPFWGMINNTINGSFSTNNPWGEIDTNVNGTFTNTSDVKGIDSNLIDSLDDYTAAGYNISRVVNPVIYQREVLTEGHLPLILDVHTLKSLNLQGNNKNFLSHSESHKSNFGNIDYTYNILVLQDEKYIWKEIKDLSEIKIIKGQKIIVDIIGNFKASIGSKSIDIIPTVEIRDYQKSFSEYAWWNSNWDYYKQITIDSIDQVPSTQTNIPILLNFTDSDLADNALDNGSDIAFTLIDNSTQLNHEIESFNGTTGDLVAWVNITSLPHDSDLVINMYYGNAGASNQEHITDTWDANYVMVQHMDGTNYQGIDDSTSNSHDAIGNNDAPTYQASGSFGDYAVGFDGDNDDISFGDHDDFTGWKTISGWFYVRDTNDNCFFLSKHTTDREWFLRWTTSSPSGYWFMLIRGTNGKYIGRINSDAKEWIPNDEWVYYTFTWDGGVTSSSIHYYVNNVQKDTVDDTNGDIDTPKNTNDAMTIGSETADYNGYGNFIANEVRMSSIVRSADWRTVQYNTVVNSDINGANPFISLGSEQSKGAGWTNTAPTFSNEVPVNQTTKQLLQPTVNVTVNDADGNTTTCDFYTSPNGSIWTHQQHNISVTANTSIQYDYTGASSYDTIYYWKVTANDTHDNSSVIYHFTTREAPFDDTDWTYNISLSYINTTDGAQTNYPMKLYVNYSGTTNNPQYVELNSHCNANFSDLRFVDYEGTELDYWVEKYTDGVNATVWIEINTINATGTGNITLHYGNSQASSESNGDNVFYWFDEFDTDTESDYTDVDSRYKWSKSIDDWTADSNNPITVSDRSGEIDIIYDDANSTFHLFYTGYEPYNIYHGYIGKDITGSVTEKNMILSAGGHGGFSILTYPNNHTAIKISELSLGIGVNDAEKYWMVFADGKNICLASASNLNATSWTNETSYNPILSNGSSGEWDDDIVGFDGISLFKDNGKYYMLFEGQDAEYGQPSHPRQSGLAESTNLTHWTKNANNPVLVGGASNEPDYISAGVQDIWKTGSTYILIYTGYGLDPYQYEALCIATSTDLENWTKDTNNPLFNENDDTWGGAHDVSDFALYRTDDKDYIFYEGGAGGTYGIGRAWCDNILDLNMNIVMMGTENNDGDERALINNLTESKYAIRAKCKATTCTEKGYVGLMAGYTDVDNKLFGRFYPDDDVVQLREFSGGVLHSISADTGNYSTSYDTYYDIEVRRDGLDVWLWNNNYGVMINGTASTYTTTDGYSGLTHSNCPAYFDNLIVRNFCYPEPTWGTPGSEQSGNTPPTVTGEIPVNTSTGIGLSPTCNVTVNDADGDNMDVTFASNYSGSWTNYQTNSSVGNGIYRWDFTGASSYSTKYWWKVYCNDGTENVSEIYYFTTKTLTWQNINTDINGEFTNTTVWKDISTSINGEFGNTTTWHNINTEINGAFTNTTTWKNIDTTINGSFSNTTAWRVISDSINGSFNALLSWQDINVDINGEFTNTTSWHDISATINGTFTNATTWQIISDAINGEFTNTTSWKVIDATINGSFNALLSWQVIDDTINGSFTNVTTWKDISTDINGAFTNTTTWQTISIDINGEFINTTLWHAISDSINGSFNALLSWQDISTTINGEFTNTTSWKDISTFVNGTFTNTTSWKDISVSINGSFTNATIWHNIDTSINGEFVNLTVWHDISTSINGDFTNITVWKNINTDINGLFTNATSWHDIDTSINGTFTSSLVWKDISVSINGSFTNTTSWRDISTEINGSFANTTSWQDISTSINGEFINTTAWQVISESINGTFINSTTWKDIDTNINGAFTNTTTWHIISDVINGTFTNTTTWNVISSIINGQFSNTTSWRGIDTNINGEFTNITSWHIINDAINGEFTNATTWNVISDIINGEFTNTTAWKVVNDDVNGQFTNTTSWKIINDDINGSFSHILSWQVIDDNINGEFANTTIWKDIPSIINGSFTNATTWHIISDSINGEFTNLTTWHVINDMINGAFTNTTNWAVISSIINGEFTNSTTWKIINDGTNGTFYNLSSHGILEPSFETVTNWTYYESDSDCYGEQSGSYVTDGSKSYMLSVRCEVETGYCKVYQERIDLTNINHIYTDVAINSDVSIDVPTYVSIRVNDDILWERRVGQTETVTLPNISIDVSSYGDYSTLEYRLNQTDVGFYDEGICIYIDNIRTERWQDISASINGEFTNTTAWRNIDTSINGQFTNTTTWKVISDAINGDFTNTTVWQNIDTSINGEFLNTTTWKIISDIINGQFTNTTAWKNIDVTINGEFANLTAWHNIDDAINGIFQNTTSWRIISESINGDFYNTTTWKNIDVSINGEFTNLTVWHIINDDINGSFDNILEWQNIHIDINGEFINTTLWKDISISINGEFLNTTTWHDINTSINGTMGNWTDYWHTINSSINGEFVNCTHTPIPDFDIIVEGSNIHVEDTSTNAYNIEEYMWNITDEEGNVGSTGWVSDTSDLDHIFTFPESGHYMITYWIKYDGNKTAWLMKGTEKLIPLVDKYEPERYSSCKSCKDADYYWYNDSCHRNPETLPWNEKPALPPAGQHDEYIIQIGEWNVDLRILIVIAILVAAIALYFRGGRHGRILYKRIVSKDNLPGRLGQDR